jgi:hypothetical protein
LQFSYSNIIYIETPEEYKGKEKSIFLAGGITGCSDWQTELVDLLKKENIAILNPRRANFPKDPKAVEEQISWEYKHLRKSDAISFWFSKETICPITLYELGAHSMTKKPLFIEVDPDYSRKQDVEIQTKLVRPEIEIAYNLNSLVRQIKKWINK